MTWAPDYITVAEFNSYSRVADTVDDVETGLWITAASRAIDEHCRRQFGNVTLQTRTYRRPAFWDAGLGLYCVEIDDVQDTTGMTVGGVALASSGAVLLPSNAPAVGRPYTMLGFTSCPTLPLLAAAPWGWTAVPTQVKAASKLQTNRFMARRDSPYGVTGTPDQGQLRLQARVDPDVAMALRGLGRAGLPG